MDGEFYVWQELELGMLFKILTIVHGHNDEIAFKILIDFIDRKHFIVRINDEKA